MVLPLEAMAARPGVPLDEVPDEDLGFTDSRRLTGPNRWYAGTAVTLTPLGLAATDPAAHLRWAARVAAVAGALGWPEPEPQARVCGAEVELLAAAPEDQLFTATEVSEWAWQSSLADTGAAVVLAWPEAGFGLRSAASYFARRAAAERRPALQALRIAARSRGLPCLVDDETLSIGAGSGSRCWPLASLPDVAALPWAELHDVPTALVTGSNGKTTTVRLVAAMLMASGRAAGLSSTTGIEVNAQPVDRGDYSGPAGARAVLRHPAVQGAVLETARGGILRRGLAVERADVALVTNISADHFGEYGVSTLAELAEVKLVVARVLGARGVLVLNADDEGLLRTAASLPHAAAARLALFAADHRHPALQGLRSSGGATCGVADGELLLCAGDVQHRLGVVEGLPLTHAGAARHNTANLAAAALVAFHLGVAPSQIAAVAQRFGSDPADNPGRLERWPWRGATVLVDYAHNPDGLARLLEVARALAPQRLTLLLGQAGNRSDDAIAELARTAAAFAPDRIVLKDMGPTYLRGRAPGEVPALLRAALLGAGVSEAQIASAGGEEAAAAQLLQQAAPGELLVLPLHESDVRERIVRRLREG